MVTSMLKSACRCNQFRHPTVDVSSVSFMKAIYRLLLLILMHCMGLFIWPFPSLLLVLYVVEEIAYPFIIFL